MTEKGGALPTPNQAWIVYQDDAIRIVLRPRSRWPEGYYDVEQCVRDAMGDTSWQSVIGVDLANKDDYMGAHPHEAVLARVLQSLSLGLV